MENGRIVDLPVYKRIFSRFLSGEFKLGKPKDLFFINGKYEDDENDERYKINLDRLCSYVKRANYKGELSCIPVCFRTRLFFINTLTGANTEIYDYVKEHIDQFDREFFKSCIETNEYSIEFEKNCFELMPIEYIDEEMVACAMIKTTEIAELNSGSRNNCKEWFFTVARRKPGVLTKDFYILGARLWGERKSYKLSESARIGMYEEWKNSTPINYLETYIQRISKKNPFLSITPEEYKTEEYYYNMCIHNSTTVMKDFPKEILTASFLQKVLDEDVHNISSFSEKALETMAPKTDKYKKMKFWKRAILMNEWVINDIPFNDERVRFFKKIYKKNKASYSRFENLYYKYLYHKNHS